MDEYLDSLREQLKCFRPEERSALLEEIQSHIHSGEADPEMGEDVERRRDRLMKEMGSASDLGSGFRAVYRPNRWLEFAIVAGGYVLSLFLTQLYLGFRPGYPWMDIRINVVFDLVLIAIAARRRSTLATLFWISFAVMQLLFIVLQGVWQPYWYFGLQTILWAAILVSLLVLLGMLLWKHRQDSLTFVFGLLPVAMQLLGTVVSIMHPVTYSYNVLDRALLRGFLELSADNVLLYLTLAWMALFFLPSDRNIRWGALLIWALLMGLGRQYLFDYATGDTPMLAPWIYYLYVLLPATAVVVAWQRDRGARPRITVPA